MTPQDILDKSFNKRPLLVSSHLPLADPHLEVEFSRTELLSVLKKSHVFRAFVLCMTCLSHLKALPPLFHLHILACLRPGWMALPEEASFDSAKLGHCPAYLAL